MSSATTVMAADAVEVPTLSPVLDMSEYLQSQYGTPSSEPPQPSVESTSAILDVVVDDGVGFAFDDPDVDIIQLLESFEGPLNKDTGRETAPAQSVITPPVQLTPTPLDPNLWQLAPPSTLAMGEATKLDEMTKRKEHWKRQAHSEREKRLWSEHQLDLIRHVICSATTATATTTATTTPPLRTPVTPKTLATRYTTSPSSLSIPQMVKLDPPSTDQVLPIRGRRLTFPSPGSRDQDAPSSPTESIVPLATPPPTQRKRRGRPPATPQTPTPRGRGRKATATPKTKRRKTD